MSPNRRTLWADQKRMSPILLLLGIIATATAMIAFDCSNPHAKFTAIDLLEPEACPDPETDYLDPVPHRIQLVRSGSKLPWKGYQCRVTLTKTVARCGFNSLGYGAQTPVWNQHVNITPDQCREAVKTGRLVVEGRERGAEVGVERVYRYYSHGSRDKHGNCETTTFTTNDVLYTKSYEHTTVVINIDIVRAMVDQAEGQIQFVNRLIAPFQDGVLHDAIHGMIIWDTKTKGCQDTTSTVYVGLVETHRRRMSQSYEDIGGAVMVMRKNSTRQYAGLLIREPHSICGKPCWGTQITGLYVCPHHAGKLLLPDSRYQAGFERDAELTQVQTELSFLHVHSSLQVSDRFTLVQTEMCKTDRKTIYNKLQAIAGANNPYSLLDVYGPGHAVYKAGAAAYVVKCAPVEVERSSFPNCTEEIPVKYQGKPMFADAYTLVLREYPTETVCNTLMPVRYRVTGKWYCSSPATLPCGSPTQLNTTTSIYTRVSDITEGMGGGVFSPEQLQAAQDFMVLHDSVKPMGRKVTSIGLQNGHEGNLGGFIPDTDMKGLSVELGSHLFPAILWFGDAWFHLSGFLFFVCVVKTLAGSAWRVLITIRTRGCGWWVVWSAWHTAFMILYTPLHLVKQTVESITRQDPLLPHDDNGRDDQGPGTELQPLSSDAPTYRELLLKLKDLQTAQEAMLSQHDLLMRRQDLINSDHNQWKQSTSQLHSPLPTAPDAAIPRPALQRISEEEQRTEEDERERTGSLQLDGFDPDRPTTPIVMAEDDPRRRGRPRYDDPPPDY